MFFEKLQNRKNDGFTLVELIVVIAILAILAGIAVPAYSGYVEKANMAADQQLVSDVVNALQLKYYDGQGKFSGTAVVTLSRENTTAAEGFAAEAMGAVFGEGWNSLTLKHKWGVGAATTKTVLNHFSSHGSDSDLYGIYNGEMTPSFAGEVDDLFVMMKDVSNNIGKGEGSALVQGAAGITIGAIEADDFATYWADTAWSNDYLMGEGKGGAYNDQVNSTTDTATLNNAIANAAVIKARNTALANYLKNQYPGNADVAAACDLITNYTLGTSTVIPADFVGDLLSDKTTDQHTQQFNDIQTAFGNLGDSVDIESAIVTYYGMDKEEGDTSKSLAEIDGLAYYAMMDTVKATASDENLQGATEEEYWDAMSGAVNLYGSIARGEASLSDLQASISSVPADSVAIIFMAGENGCAISVSPAAAMAG